jgi:hypothetical protein
MTFPVIVLAPYFSRSQPHTYAIAAMKKPIAHITNMKSRIAAYSLGRLKRPGVYPKLEFHQDRHVDKRLVSAEIREEDTGGAAGCATGLFRRAKGRLPG